jgi:hypothetical protein
MHFSSVLLLSLALVAGHVAEAAPRPPHVKRGGYKTRFVKNRSLLASERQQETFGKRDVVSGDISQAANATASDLIPDVAVNATDLDPSDPLIDAPSNATTAGYDTIPPKLDVSSPEVSSIVSQLVASTTAYDTFTYSAYTPPTTTSPSYAEITTTSSSAAAAYTPRDPVSDAVAAAESYALNQYMNRIMPTVTVELVLVPTQVS